MAFNIFLNLAIFVSISFEINCWVVQKFMVIFFIYGLNVLLMVTALFSSSYQSESGSCQYKLVKGLITARVCGR